jgi:hypothetical protein
MQITITQESLETMLVKFLSDDFIKAMDDVDLDEDERQANIVLSRKKINLDAKNLAELVFKAYNNQ